MKFKSILVRSLRRSRNPPPSDITLPHNEANEDYGSEIDEHNVPCDPHCENGDTDVEVVPDSLEERNVPSKKPQCFGSSNTDNSLESLNLDACIMCGIKDELVWHCSGIDCPISIHGKCVNDEPGNEDAANRYCPYCWFKIQVLRSNALREKAVAAQKALFKYLDKEINGGGKKEEAVPKVGENKTGLSSADDRNQKHPESCADIGSDQHLHLEGDVCPSREGQARSEKVNDRSVDYCVQLNQDIDHTVDRNGQLNEDANQSRDRCKQLGKDINQSKEPLVRLEKGIHQPVDQLVGLEKYQQNKVYMAERDVGGKDKATEGQQLVEMNEEKTSDRFQASESEERSETEKFHDAEDGKNKETAKGQRKSDARTENTADGSPYVSIRESFSRNESVQVQSNLRQKRRRKIIEFDSDVSSNESTNERNGQDVTEQSNGSFKSSSSRGVTSPLLKTKNQKIKSTAAKIAQQKRETSSIKNDKRKRLSWMPEEEAMLGVGMETFSGEVNRNIPWRKILDMGANVFHETRTPTDLKDKWRTMNSKK